MHIFGEFCFPSVRFIRRILFDSRSTFEQEEILASENKLTALPESLDSLPAIERVDVRSNDLRTLPLKLCRVVSGALWPSTICTGTNNISFTHQPTMQELLCDNNPNLEQAPPNMRGKSELLIWCLEMQQKYKDVIDPKSNRRKDLLDKSNTLQNDIAAAQRKIQQLESEIAMLQRERPSDYIYYKGRAMTVARHVLTLLRNLWHRAKQAFVAWRERRTHPLY
jgi:hypothetical protein